MPVKYATWPLAPVPVTGLVKAFCLLLNVDQSDALNAPRLAADAVGTFSVITGVVVPFATVLDKSVPDVPKVKAATLVTVPLPVPAPMSVLTSAAVRLCTTPPLIVKKSPAVFVTLDNARSTNEVRPPTTVIALPLPLVLLTYKASLAPPLVTIIP